MQVPATPHMTHYDSDLSQPLEASVHKKDTAAADYD